MAFFVTFFLLVANTLMGCSSDQSKEDSTLTITGSDLGGAERTILDVEGKKTFQSALLEQKHKSDSRGWRANAGFAIDSNSIGVTGGGGLSHGYYRGEQGIHRLSHVGTLSGHTDLGEGKTTLIGAQIFGKSVSGITEELHIESPQGTGHEKGRQWSADIQATVGYGGASVSGSASYAELRSNHKSVNAQSGNRDAGNALRDQGNQRNQQANTNLKASDQAYNQAHAHLSGQSGIYSGDDGYHLINRGQAYLKGGIITSSQAAEEQGNNRFITAPLKFEDVKSRSEALTVQEDAYLHDALADLYLGIAPLYGNDMVRQNVQALLYPALRQSNMQPLNYTYPFVRQ